MAVRRRRQPGSESDGSRRVLVAFIGAVALVLAAVVARDAEDPPEPHVIDAVALLAPVGEGAMTIVDVGFENDGDRAALATSMALEVEHYEPVTHRPCPTPGSCLPRAGAETKVFTVALDGVAPGDVVRKGIHAEVPADGSLRLAIAIASDDPNLGFLARARLILTVHGEEHDAGTFLLMAVASGPAGSAIREIEPDALARVLDRNALPVVDAALVTSTMSAYAVTVPEWVV